MAFQSVPDTLQCVLTWTSQGQAMNNVLHFKTGGATVDAALAALFDTAITNAANASTWFDTDLSNQLELTSITIRDLEVEGSLPFVRGIGISGDVAIEPLPLMVALVTTLRTAFAGRSGRGRMYHMGFVGGSLDPTDLNFISAAAAARANTWFALIKDNVAATVGAAFVPAVVSRFHDNVKLAVGIGRPVISHDTGLRLDTQRRRRPPGVQ